MPAPGNVYFVLSRSRSDTSRSHSPTISGAKYVLMKCAAVTWSSPLHRGVHETSPSPTRPSSEWTFTSRNGETECDPPRPLLIASSGLIGTRTGIVSMRLIFMVGPLTMHLLATHLTTYQTDVADAGY